VPKKLPTPVATKGSRGGWNHIFRLRSCSKVFDPDHGSKFKKSENPTPVQSPATIDATAIQQ